jgi:hypothetical protein
MEWAGERRWYRGAVLGSDVFRVVASIFVVAAAYLGAAWIGGVAPFEGRAAAPYSERGVLRAIPFDAPLPYDIELVGAGRGERLPYHTRWTSDLAAAEVAAQVREHLEGSPKWQHTQLQPLASEFSSTFARIGSDGYMTHFAVMSIAEEGGGTVVVFDFTPIPTTLAPAP